MHAGGSLVRDLDWPLNRPFTRTRYDLGNEQRIVLALSVRCDSRLGALSHSAVDIERRRIRVRAGGALRCSCGPSAWIPAREVRCVHVSSTKRLHRFLREAVDVAAGDSAAALLRKGWDEGMTRLHLRHCTRVGHFARVYGRPRISNKGVLTIGDHVSMLSTVVPCELLVFEGASLEIGAHSFINYGTSIAATGSVRIGRHCLLGMYSIIFDNDFHQVDHRRTRPEPSPVVLEDNVWLGHRTLVLPGVTIGHDSVVGAGSIVVKDIPPRSIAVGNPARVIRSF